jgi:hypothetical protein
MIWKVSRILYAQHRQDWEETQAGTETDRHALPQYKEHQLNDWNPTTQQSKRGAPQPPPQKRQKRPDESSNLTTDPLLLRDYIPHDHDSESSTILEGDTLVNYQSIQSSENQVDKAGEGGGDEASDDDENTEEDMDFPTLFASLEDAITSVDSDNLISRSLWSPPTLVWRRRHCRPWRSVYLVLTGSSRSNTKRRRALCMLTHLLLYLLSPIDTFGRKHSDFPRSEDTSSAKTTAELLHLLNANNHMHGLPVCPVDWMTMSFGQAHDVRLIDCRGLLRMSQLLVMVGQIF